MHVLGDLHPYLVHTGSRKCKCSETIPMGKTRHHTLLPRLWHVHYTTRATTRGPKLSKTAVEETKFRASPSKSARNSHPENVGDTQHEDAGGWPYRDGKVCENPDGIQAMKSYGCHKYRRKTIILEILS